MHNIIINIITSKDVLKHCADCLTQAYNAEPWNDKWTKEKAHEKLECFFDSPKFIGFTAHTGEELIGACVGNVEPYYTGDYFYLKEMFIVPHAQKHGAGQKLLSALRNHLNEIGVQQIILFTSSEFFPFHFYEKAGFNPVDGMVMMHLENA